MSTDRTGHSDHQPERRLAGPRRAVSGQVVPSRQARAEEPQDHDGPSQADIEQFGGVTRPCPKCKKEVHDDTLYCYHCGHNIDEMPHGRPNRLPAWVVLVGAGLIVAFMASAMIWIYVR